MTGLSGEVVFMMLPERDKVVFVFIEVDQGRVELPSIQGKEMLSTRLARSELSAADKERATNLQHILLKFRPPCEAAANYFRICCTT